MKFICINSVCHKIYNGESDTLTRSWVFFYTNIVCAQFTAENGAHVE